jgi:hypothetical protein
MAKLETFGVRETAVTLGFTQKYVRDLLYEDRIPGAHKIGREWVIPAASVEQMRKRRMEEQEQYA